MKKLPKKYYMMEDLKKEIEYFESYLKKEQLESISGIEIIPITKENTNILTKKEKRVYMYYQWYLERYQLYRVVIPNECIEYVNNDSIDNIKDYLKTRNYPDKEITKIKKRIQKESNRTRYLLIYSDMITDSTKEDTMKNRFRYRLFCLVMFGIWKHPLRSTLLWILFLIFLSILRILN